MNIQALNALRIRTVVNNWIVLFAPNNSQIAGVKQNIVQTPNDPCSRSSRSNKNNSKQWSHTPLSGWTKQKGRNHLLQGTGRPCNTSPGSLLKNMEGGQGQKIAVHQKKIHFDLNLKPRDGSKIPSSLSKARTAMFHKCVIGTGGCQRYGESMTQHYVPEMCHSCGCANDTLYPGQGGKF